MKKSKNILTLILAGFCLLNSCNVNNESITSSSSTTSQNNSDSTSDSEFNTSSSNTSTSDSHDISTSQNTSDSNSSSSQTTSGESSNSGTNSTTTNNTSTSSSSTDSSGEIIEDNFDDSISFNNLLFEIISEEEKTCAVKKCVKYYFDERDEEIVIPKMYGEYKVIGILSEEFSNNDFVKSIVLQDNIQFFGELFNNTDYLNEDSLPNSLYYRGTIEDWCNIKISAPFHSVFSSSDLDEIMLQVKYDVLPNLYFLNSKFQYEKVKVIDIPETVTNIGAYQFLGFKDLVNVNCHNKVTSIGDYSFSCCSIKTFYFPKSIISISDNSFYWSYLFGLYFEAASKQEEWNKALQDFWDYLNNSEDLNIILVKGVSSEYIIDDILYYPYYVSENNEDSYYLVALKYFGNSENISIPSYLKFNGKEYCVDTIGHLIFCGYSFVKTISIPASIKTIGFGAFAGCTSLESFYIPDNVKTIGDSAFSGCSSLKFINIPKYLKTIGSCAFYGCASLESIFIPNYVEEIGSSAFHGCTSLKSINIPTEIKTIENYTFYGCTSLTSVYIPKNVEEIEKQAFGECSSLKYIYCQGNYISGHTADNWYPDSTIICWGVSYDEKIIEKDNFIYSIYDSNIATIIKYLGNEENVNIPSTIEIDGINCNIYHIGSYAFQDCQSLKSVVIPDSVSTIGWGAFAGCTSLKNVTLPKNIESIKYETFAECSSLETINLPSSITLIDEESFWGCTSLESINIPSSVEIIGSLAFAGCSSLKMIYIPKSVTEMGGSVFQACSSLVIYCEGPAPTSTYNWRENWNDGRPVYWNIDMDNIVEVDGVIYLLNDTNATIISYVKNESKLIIPSSISVNESKYDVVAIGSCAFQNCPLKIVYIPKSIIKIGDSIFNYLLVICCEDYKKPDNWNDEWNCENTVYWNTNQNSIVEINDILYLLFNDTAIIIDYIGNNKELIIPSSISVNGFSYTVTTIEIGAFSNCAFLESIKLPNTIILINDVAFALCTSLTSIVIPSNVVSMGSSIFYGCSSLKVYIEKNCDMSGWDDCWDMVSFDSGQCVLYEVIY